MNSKPDYPVKFNVDYSPSSNRLTTFFRLFMVLPIAILYSLLIGSTTFIVFPTLLMIVFKQKYPKWWFDFNLALTQFTARVGCYVMFLTDEYPSTDDEQSVHLSFEYPNTERDLNRLLPLVKWFLAIPHFIVLALLSPVSILLSIIAWFSILFTGQYPKSIFDFQTGLFTWLLRVKAYSFLLITDLYPPFKLQ